MTQRNTRGKSTAPVTAKKWLTVQITEEQNTILEQYCSKTNKTKADVVREVINSIDLYAAFQEKIRREFLGKLS